MALFMGKPAKYNLDILGNDYEIKEYKSKFSKDKAWGQCFKDQHVIKFRLSKKELFNLHTEVHEVFHAIWYEHMLEESEEEERAVACLASGFLKVLAANPHFLNHITQTLNKNARPTES